MEKITYRKTLDVHKNGIQFMLQGFETADKMSRVVEISLMASGDAIDFPSERLTALMYVTSPGAAEPSIYECRIVDSKIVYEVLPIATEGITELQIKLIETDENGAKSVLATPRFAIEVGKSNAEDEEAEKKPEFTALEEATARAKLVYDERFIRMEIAEDGTFTAHYADGTTYETDVIARMLVAASTELDLSALVKNGLTSFTADEVAGEIKADLDAEYKDFFAKAVYSTDLMGNYPEARFVHWDENTIATPFKAVLTDKTKGFALVMGDGTTNHTVLAWCMGEKTRTFYSRFISGGVDTGWRDGKINLATEVEDILPIKNGGTGAASAEKARSKLDVPSKKEFENRFNWNIDENIGVIGKHSETIRCTGISQDKIARNTFEFVMINSGTIYVQFVLRLNAHVSDPDPLLIGKCYVKTGGATARVVDWSGLPVTVYEDKRETITLQLDVNKGDMLTFELEVQADDYTMMLEDIRLLANVATPFKYAEMTEIGSDYSSQDIVNALLGVE